MNIELRTAEIEDLETVLDLVAAYHAFEGLELSAAARRAAVTPLLGRSNDLGRIWLVLAGTEVLGYLALCFGYSIEFGGRDAFVDELYLVERARGKGIGRKVLARVQEMAPGLGVTALHLEVASGNTVARELYAKMGFESRAGYHLMSYRPVAGDA